MSRQHKVLSDKKITEYAEFYRKFGKEETLRHYNIKKETLERYIRERVDLFETNEDKKIDIPVLIICNGF